jgi:hypothetical protein
VFENFEVLPVLEDLLGLVESVVAEFIEEAGLPNRD